MGVFFALNFYDDVISIALLFFSVSEPSSPSTNYPSTNKETNIGTKWYGWFRPLSRGWREGSLIAVPIEISQGKKLKVPLVITVPSSCGCAVRRNRFRRMVKAYFEIELSKARLSTKKVSPKTGNPESVQIQHDAGSSLPNVEKKSPSQVEKKQNDRGPEKAIWIRLLNRHRLDRKILLEDWKKDLDTLARKALR